MSKPIMAFLFGILKWFSMIPNLLASLVVDVHQFLDEKKVWGVIYLTAALVAPFVLTTDLTILASIAVVGVALFLGVPLGDQVPIVANLKGLGIFDLVTNKANQGDPSRLFGNIFLAVALGYLFTPRWTPGFEVRAEYFWVLSGVGLVLLGVAIFGDKAVVAKETE